MATQQAEGRKRVEDFRKAYNAMKSGEGTPQDAVKGEVSQDPEERRDQRSKHNRPPAGAINNEEREG